MSVRNFDLPPQPEGTPFDWAPPPPAPFGTKTKPGDPATMAFPMKALVNITIGTTEYASGSVFDAQTLQLFGKFVRGGKAEPYESEAQQTTTTAKVADQGRSRGTKRQSQTTGKPGNPG